jgi:photosystem II stability/assembly factor-like uncharacterized protein
MTKLFIATGDAFIRISETPDNPGSPWIAEITLDHRAAKCIAIDPLDTRALYLGTFGHGLWKSGDGGLTWQQVDFPEPNVLSVAVSPANGALYAGCEPSMLWRSDDGGATWRELETLRQLPSQPTWSFPPRPWTSHVRWIAPNPVDPDLLLAGIELGGVMLSEDGGATWQDHRPGAQKDCHALAWHPRETQRAYQAAGGGAAYSRDGGRSWIPADEGRDRHYTWALAVDPDDAGCWYISASPSAGYAHHSDPADARAHIYRRQDDAPWERLQGGLPDPLDHMPYALALHNGILYAGLSNGQIYTSSDRGDHWFHLDFQGDPVPRIDALLAVE